MDLRRTLATHIPELCVMIDHNDLDSIKQCDTVIIKRTEELVQYIAERSPKDGYIDVSKVAYLWTFELLVSEAVSDIASQKLMLPVRLHFRM